MSTPSISIRGVVNLGGGFPTTMSDPGTTLGQHTIEAGGTLTATLHEDWTATAATTNKGIAILFANGNDVNLAAAKGSSSS